MRFGLSGLLCTIFAATASASCYTVYDQSDRIIYRSTASPVDLSQSVRDQVQQRWPGASLIIAPDSVSCSEIVERPQIRSTATSANLSEVLENMSERGVGEIVPSAGGAASAQAGKDVYVRGYTRKDGTVVQAHTRSAPGSRGGGRGR